MIIVQVVRIIMIQFVTNVEIIMFPIKILQDAFAHKKMGAFHATLRIAIFVKVSVNVLPAILL